MKMSFILSMTLSLIFCGVSAHAEICFQDVTSFQQVRSSLPAVLKNYPLYIIHQSFEVTGAFAILANGKNIEIDIHANPVVGEAINKTALVRQACLSGNQLTIQLNDETSETLTVNQNSFTIEGYEFSITDLATYKEVVAQAQGN